MLSISFQLHNIQLIIKLLLYILGGLKEEVPPIVVIFLPLPKIMTIDMCLLTSQKFCPFDLIEKYKISFCSYTDLP